MSELYLVFFGVAVLLFAVVFVLSWREKKRSTAYEKKIKSEELNNNSPNVTQLSSESTHYRAPVKNKISTTVTKNSNDKKEISKTSLVPKSILETELVAKIESDESISQEQIILIYQDYLIDFSCKVSFFGLNELTAQWCDIQTSLPSAKFEVLGISIQLGDQSGVIKDKELEKFYQLVLAFANALDSPYRFSMDYEQAQKNAKYIRALKTQFDMLVMLHIVPRQQNAFRVADMESCAADIGLILDKSGVFIKPEVYQQKKTVLYRVYCSDGKHYHRFSRESAHIEQLVVYLVVPNTPEPEKSFSLMMNDAIQLATWLGGKLVDHKGRVITQTKIDKLESQISTLVREMEDKGITPGDALCKKIF